MKPSLPHRSRSTQRTVGFDVARALAVFGMVVVNFKLVMGAADSGPAWLAAVIGLLDGRAAATFVVLAGVGVSLMSKRSRESGDAAALRSVRSALLRRALFLFVVGLLYLQVWPADILHFYGVYLAFAAFLLATPSRRLIALAACAAALFVVLIFALDYERGWNFATLEYSGVFTPRGMMRHLFFNGFHPALPWIGFLLVGMVLGRARLDEARVRRLVLAGGVLVALGAELLSQALIAQLSRGADAKTRAAVEALFGTAPMPPMPLYLLAAGGTACAVIVLALEVVNRWPEARWLAPLVATGQMALTLYVAHVVVGMGTLEAVGRLEDQSLSFVLAAVAAFCGASVLFAHLWLQRFDRGPVEAVMRRVTDRAR